jgi:hypothetical protein
MARFSASFSAAGATKRVGCSHQYELNSVRLVDERMKGGAVREERSPLKDAMDCEGGTAVCQRRAGGVPRAVLRRAGALNESNIP